MAAIIIIAADLIIKGARSGSQTSVCDHDIRVSHSLIIHTQIFASP